jgi:hypothetical protein
MSQFKDLIELELRNSLGLLMSLRDRDELSMYPEEVWASKTAERIASKFEGEYVPFVSEVEEFNALMNKPNTYEPNIPENKGEWQFVYDFILEELEEYKQACEEGNIVEVLDALCDITYVSLGNGAMLHGLKDKVWPAYMEVQASNLSKACDTQEEAEETVKVRSEEQGEACHWEQVGNKYIVYRSRDRKVMKNINYFRPDLKQFF